VVVTLAALRAAQVVSSLDEHFALAMGRIARETSPEVLLAAALASRAVRSGDVCLDVPRLLETPVAGLADGEASLAGEWPDGRTWMEALARSRLVGGPDGESPLVLDDAGRLYLRRYWTYQARLAEAIAARAAVATVPLDAEWLRQVLARLFPSPSEATVDWQRLAAVLAVLRPFCVISGGPGTGKTYTVVKILALLIEAARHGGRPAPRITLVAPTGKAAARLAETIRRTKVTLPFEEAVKQAIPEAAATIHRCLGWRGGSGTRFYHNAANPLLTDIVLVDEASMVDLALMAHLFEAIPSHARVILLGDRDQLASVEAGAVLGDICNTGEGHRYSAALAAAVAEVGGEPAPLGAPAPAPAGMGDCIVELQHSYRYGPASGIGRFAAAVKAGDADRALEILAQRDLEDLGHQDLSADGRPGPRLSAEAVSGFRPYLSEPDPLARLRAFARFRVLCAHRRGAGGAEEVNALVEAALRAAGLLEAEDHLHGDYVGRPLMVTTNDYHVNLFNGDVGIVGADSQRPAGRVVFFEGEGGELRRLAPSRLPPHETALAMSVHKSQGSEFDEVAVLLPQRPSPVVTRELLYTAVTRARRKVTIHGPLEVVRHAITCPTRRASGLRDLLWGPRRS